MLIHTTQRLFAPPHMQEEEFEAAIAATAAAQAEATKLPPSPIHLALNQAATSEQRTGMLHTLRDMPHCWSAP